MGVSLPPERRMKKLGNALIAASSLFFVESAFEMYLLTYMHGHQMLFFSLAHVSFVLFCAVALSGVAFAALAVFALVIVSSNLLGRSGAGGSYHRLMLSVLLVQSVHTILLLTYDWWAGALFS